MEETEKLQNNDVPVLEPDTKVKTELKADDWLCVVCHKKITSDKYRFGYNNQSEFRFTNPAGYSFDILTFASAEGCMVIGEPTMDFTWFEGHAWSYALCSRCNNHLGWKYTGRYSFFGLIKSRMIKGLALFN